ncbi:unnamed protein product [Mytilus edulis]|uniref:Uncharacterized protein n=1 Tax=Mytilus edulis TaxID=6550 RepID=A0A8S3TQP0_MYTED|nr:unnamed protein product [Mytilus edulis]
MNGAIVIRNVVLLTFTTFACGFLLDNQNAEGQTVGSQQYLTVSEFYHAKTELQDRLVNLRHDTDNKLVLLSSQLQNMIISFKKEIVDNNSRSDDLENKYLDLLQNHAVLQDELDALKRKYTELTMKFAVSENITQALQEEISDMKNLKSIHQLQDLTTLQSRVNTISGQTHSLAVNEQARNEDFRALYNLTVNQNQLTDKSIKALESETNYNMKELAFNTSNTIKSLELNTSNSIKSLELKTSNSIKSLELNMNNSVDSLMINQNLMSNSFGMKTQKLEGILNSSMASMQQQITSSNKRGMLMKCYELASKSKGV